MKLLSTLNEVVALDKEGNSVGFKMVKDQMTIQVNQNGLYSTVKLTATEFLDLTMMLERKRWREKV